MAKKPGKRSLRMAIKQTGGVISELAEHYTVTRQTIYNWLDDYEMRPLISAARGELRAVAKDVIYEHLLAGDKDIAMFVMRHVRDNGEMIILPPDILRLMYDMGISSSDVVNEFVALMRASAATQRRG